MYRPVSILLSSLSSTAMTIMSDRPCSSRIQTESSVTFMHKPLNKHCHSLRVYRLPPLVLELRPRSILLRKLSMLGRRELELERRRRWRSSSGSLGDNPLARAKRFRTSVKLTTPVRRPLMFCPGKTAALTAAPGPMPVIEDPGELCVGSSRECGRGWTCELVR